MRQSGGHTPGTHLPHCLCRSVSAPSSAERHGGGTEHDHSRDGSDREHRSLRLSTHSRTNPRPHATCFLRAYGPPPGVLRHCMYELLQRDVTIQVAEHPSFSDLILSLFNRWSEAHRRLSGLVWPTSRCNTSRRRGCGLTRLPRSCAGDPAAGWRSAQALSPHRGRLASGSL